MSDQRKRQCTKCGAIWEGIKESVCPRCESPSAQSFDAVFDSVRLSDSTVNAMLKHGRSLKEIVVALVYEKNLFAQRIMELESIAPRKLRLQDGRVMVWLCPEHLIPESPKYDVIPDPQKSNLVSAQPEQSNTSNNMLQMTREANNEK